MHHMTANWCPTALRGAQHALLRGVGHRRLDRPLARGRQHVGARRLGRPGGELRARAVARRPAGPVAGGVVGAPPPRCGGAASTASSVPAPWSPTIAELLADGARRPGLRARARHASRRDGRRASSIGVAEVGRARGQALGLALLGAFRTAMRSDTRRSWYGRSRDWPSWTRSSRRGRPAARWRRGGGAAPARGAVAAHADDRCAPGPLRTGRQPQIEDRRPLDEL